jgi:hypothetical protein
MAERRYREDEVTAIFRRATEEQKVRGPAMPPGEGLTLADVQQIGRDVGIEPQLIARAAAALDRPEGTTVRTFLRLPIRVGRTVELDRLVTDAEWQQLVVDLDEIFNAQGVVRFDGGVRSWRNGNLRVTIEPGESASRLRLGTYNAVSHRMMRIGLGLGAVTAAGAVISAIGHVHFEMGALGIAAAVVFGMGAVRLPWWGHRRLAQMNDVAQKLLGAPGTAA